MKQTGWMIIWLLCSFEMFAAAENVRRADDGGEPFYLQVFGGLNKSANEHLPWSEWTSHPWSGGMFVAVGREWTPLWGWRSAFRYNHNKGRNVPECEDRKTWGWDNLGLFGDLTFDLADAFSPQDRQGRQRFRLKAFAGVGVTYTFGFPSQTPLSYEVPYSRNSRLGWALRAGATAGLQLTKRWQVGLECSHTLFSDRFNGVKQGAVLDGRTNLKLGLTFFFVKPKAKPRPEVVYANRLTQMPALPLQLPQTEETKVRQIAGRAFLDFPVNETKIYPDYRNNPSELRRIRAMVDSALFDRTIQVTKISLHGYASPESPYANNTRLAKGRTDALAAWLQSHYSLPQDVFDCAYTPEDWQNLRDFIAEGNRRRVKGDIWYDNAAIRETPETPDFVRQHRDELLAVIDSDTDPDGKESVLKQVGGGQPYRWLLQHVYPGLRHTDYIIEYVVQHYPVGESRRLIYTHPEALSLREMYQVAESYDEGSDGWIDALLIAARQFPDDEEANLNAACACVKVHRLTDAKRYLSRAGQSAEARYLDGIIAAMEGRKNWQLQDGKVVVSEKKE